MNDNFSSLIDGAAFNDGVFSLTIPSGWMQGRTTYGGLSAALCLETALRAFPDLPPLRSALVSFIGPAGGAVEGRANLLRRGKSVAFVESELTSGAGVATRCNFAFGARRESEFDRTFTPRPSLPGPDACEPFFPEIPAQNRPPSFTDHFGVRLAKGARPVSGASEHEFHLWVRHQDPHAQGIVALLALADMPPPAVFPMFKSFAPISSMTWMVNILSDKPDSKDGWWLLQSRGENASEGYSSQDMLVWNSDGELVIAGRQSVAIFV
ncbi:thioesterase family protein [Hyphococcus flavus]|uniref:Thioesterase family protein n=1 Tax=Hyphococcus flavus TaxID=1866326 RepID=A0AAE9Z9X4_9PROT|nr:thioesterase family protein [Hyphococcus flavus]WDI30049.1 thioesterase family protein [Hyphococcus flavus]